MTSEDRKIYILKKLKNNTTPISASTFGKELDVSRQVIVNDVALLRALGEPIIALPRGYVIERNNDESYVIACKHGKDDLEDELLTIINCGCGVKDVIVEHDIYGQISAKLCIYSQNDIKEFMDKLNSSTTNPLCTLTNEYHFHTLQCPSDKHFEDVKKALQDKKLCL